MSSRFSIASSALFTTAGVMPSLPIGTIGSNVIPKERKNLFLFTCECVFLSMKNPPINKF